MLLKSKELKSAHSNRQKRIYDFLQSNQVGVLSSVDPDNNPHASVIYYSLDKSFQITFITKSKTKKFDNITHNNHVMLLVYNAENQTVAQVVGKAYQLVNSDKMADVAASVYAANLISSNDDIPPVAKLSGGEYVLFKIVPVQIRLATYIQPESDYDNIFDTIESFHPANG